MPMNVHHEVAVYEKMAAELPDYILAEVLFWQMQAGSDFPKLSLGMLLLTRARLGVVQGSLSPAQRGQRDKANAAIESVLARWPVAAESKAERELRSRANLWQRFWDDCREQPATCADNYPHAVTQRVIAELLLREFPRLRSSPEAKPLEAVDQVARGRLQGDSFVWAPELQPGFPASDFWFLYRQPRPNER